MPSKTDQSGMSSSLSRSRFRWQFSLASLLRGMAVCGILCALWRWLASDGNGRDSGYLVHVAALVHPLAVLMFPVAFFAAPAAFVGMVIRLTRRPHGCWTGWVFLGAAAMATSILFLRGFDEARLFRALDIVALANAAMWLEFWARGTVERHIVALGLAAIIMISYGSVITTLAVWAAC